MHAHVHAKSLQSCPTACDPMDCSPLGSSVSGIHRQEYWSGWPASIEASWKYIPQQSDKLYMSWPLRLSSVQSLSRVQLFATSWTAELQASLSITNSRSLLKLMSIESVMPSNHLILCHPLLLPSILPGIRVFSNESVLRWPKYWSFSFSISPSNELIGWISLQSKGPSRVLSNTTVQKHQFFGTQLPL